MRIQGSENENRGSESENKLVFSGSENEKSP